MENKKDIQKELEELSPLLAKMKREQPQTGFSVPPAYFKNLTDEIIEIKFIFIFPVWVLA